MRVEAIDFDLMSQYAYQYADQLNYLDLKGAPARISHSSLSNKTGRRFLKENNMRSVDIYEVVKNLSLSRTDTKMMILMMLSRGDLMVILQLLNKKQLINGLRLFDKQKLLKLIMRLPKRMLMKMLKYLYTNDKLIERMNTNELINIMRSERLGNQELMKSFYYMEMKFLHQLMGKLFGKDMSNLSHREIMDVLLKTRKDRLVEEMKLMSFKALTPFITRLVNNDEELLQRVSDVFIFKMFDNMTKGMMIQTFDVVPEDIIINNFLSQLPDRLLMMVAAQVDTNDFQQYLVSQQFNLLAQLGESGAVA